jgi:hypothetical protein
MIPATIAFLMSSKSKTKVDGTGKVVEAILVPRMLWAFGFNYSHKNVEEVLRRVMKALAAIARSRQRRVRDRSLTLWSGNSEANGASLFIIGMPFKTSHRISDIFYKHLQPQPGFVEFSSTDPASVSAVPLLRYDHGRLVVYAGPFETQPKLFSLKLVPLQYEICGYRERAKHGAGIYYKPTRPDSVSPDVHSEETWERNREQILKFVWNLKAPCGYRRLKSILRDCFGISVYEEQGADFHQYGIIRLGYDQGGPFPRVRILINSRLDNRLKYIVLSHEVAHYVLHFRLLLLADIVEAISWAVPELGQYYQYVLTGTKCPLGLRIEEEADEFCANFIIPPWFLGSAKPITSAISEGGESPRPEEMIWRFLQPHFPETKFAETSWRNLPSIKQQALEDQSHISEAQLLSCDGLFERVFRAALRTAQRSGDSKRQFPSEEVISKMTDLIDRIKGLPSEDARKSVRKLLPSSSATKKEEVSNDFSGGVKAFRRKLIPPLRDSGVDLYPLIPLEPAADNSLGAMKGEWVVRNDLAQLGTIAELRESYRDHGMLLHQLESWQRKRHSPGSRF